MPSTEELKRIASQVRRDIIRMVHHAASGHPGGSLGAADIMTALYFEIMKPDPARFSMDGIGEDLLFLSNGHISPVWYSVLARYGYFDTKELGTFRMLGTRLQGHPCTDVGLHGIRMASGSLGQGLSVSCGAALAKRLNGDSHKIYCLLGDGELEEGQNWEAMMFASARKIDNLIAIIDYNGQQIDGPVEEVIHLNNLEPRLSSFGWTVISGNGNDMKEVVNILRLAGTKTGHGAPVAVLMRTHMGMGVDFMLDDHAWHGSAPNDELAKKALGQLEETLGDY